MTSAERVAKYRADKKRIDLYVSSARYKELQEIALKNRTSVQALITKALENVK